MQGLEGYLIKYFIDKVCPGISLSPEVNPYYSVVLPLAHSFDPLRYILLASAACQLRLWGNKDFTRPTLSFRTAAIRGLSQYLETNLTDWMALVTIIMFCFHDVSITAALTGSPN